MKIILLKDVPKLGRKYDIKEVNDGYALNFLIPQKLADKATPEKVERIEKLKKENQRVKEMGEIELKKALLILRGLVLIMKAKASDRGHLFSKIHPKDIVEKLKNDHQISLDQEALEIDSIKEIGEFEIPVLVNSQKSSFKLIVESEK